MKKLILIPAILALSTNVAFAIDLEQWVKLHQSIGDTLTSGFALNRAFILQKPIPINNDGPFNFFQRATIDQSIGDTSSGGTAINNAVIFQGQLPASF